MGCVLAMIRPVVALVLGVVVFFGFLFLLLSDNFTDRLLSAEFYTDTLEAEDTYNRIYDDVMLDPELESTTQDLLGDIQVVSHADIVGLLREIVPPAYLRSQSEGSIQRTVGYFNGDLEDLEVYVELGPPLSKVKPALFGYIDRRIDGLTEEDLGSLPCTSQRVTEVADLYRGRLERLSAGEVPEGVPSLDSFDSGCRRLIFGLAFDQLVGQRGLDERARAGLVEQRPDIEKAFVVDGDTRGVLKLAARPLATPLMDDAIDRLRAELDERDRLDLIYRIALWNDDYSEETLRSDFDDARDWVSWGRKFGKAVALTMLIAGAVLMGLVHYPSVKNGIRWPGVTLFLTGLVFFVGGKVLQSQVPDRLQDLVDRGTDQVSVIPSSVNDLGGDLLLSFGKQLTEGFAGASLTLLIVGALLIGASFFVNYVLFALKLVLLPVGLARRGLSGRQGSGTSATGPDAQRPPSGRTTGEWVSPPSDPKDP